MLEFIVLGDIPGSSFVITFNWVLIASGILLALPIGNAVLRSLKKIKLPEVSLNTEETAQTA